MKYGNFDDKNKEYVINRPDIPLPWINYIGCQDYFGIITNTAGGYSFYKDARLRRITRYRYNNVPLDSNGRYIYVKDGKDIWNPGWKPTRTELDKYQCRHGLGYSIISGEKNNLSVSVKYFVPLDHNLEIWDIEIENKATKDKNIDLWGFVEWCLWDAMDDMTNFQRNFSIGETEVEPGVIFHKTEYRERRNHYAYFAIFGSKTYAWDTSRDNFVGVHNGYDTPETVLNGKSTSKKSLGWAPIAAIQTKIKLKSKEKKRFHFILGYEENPENKKFNKDGSINKSGFKKIAAKFANSKAVDSAFTQLKDYWNELLSIYQAEIPEKNMNRMVNIWNQYQCMTTLNMSRSASLYESGIGRGMGYRDSNQDILGVVHIQPERCRERILDLAATQLSDGTCYHQFQPLTKKGNSMMGSGFNDDPLWLILSVSAYINETGDISILREKIGFADKNNKDEATLLDHLEISMKYTLNNRGPHGLPLIGHADWNDCLNLNCFSKTPGESFQLAGDIGGDAAKIAESVMIAGLFCFASSKMSEIYHILGMEKEASAISEEGKNMREIMKKHAWDGQWFIRAFDAYGNPVGSKKCKEGKIFIESQGWAVLGGVGIEEGLAKKALDSVKKYLATEDGIILQQPAYSTYHLELGEISSYPPGYKENAGIFTHNNTWIQIAETIVGRGDLAFEYYMSVCPSAKEKKIDTYRCEPYVYSQMTAGRDAMTPGEAKNSFLTGTASWSFVAASQYILGIRPEFNGLRIDPCIPKKWKSFKITRTFRNKIFYIHVKNPNGLSKGIKELTVNGKKIDGNLISLDIINTNDKKFRVEAIIE